MSAWQILASYVALVGWTFVGFYLTRRWWKSAAGWNVMVFTASLAAVFTLLAVATWVHVPRWLWLVLVTLIAAVMTHRLALLLHSRRADRMRGQ